MSSSNSFEFNDFIPPELYQEYFDVMVNDGKVFICVIQNASQVGSVYLEQPLEKADDVDGVIRVFFNKAEVQRYGKSIAAIEEVDLDLVSKWEMKFSAFVDYIVKIDAKYKSSSKKGVRAIASAINDNKYINLDTLWTSEYNLKM